MSSAKFFLAEAMKNKLQSEYDKLQSEYEETPGSFLGSRSLKNRESRNSCSVNVGGVGVSSWSVSSSLSSAKICMAAAMYDAILSYLAAARPAI